MAALSWTLATLKQQMQDHLEDDGTEFVNELNTLIQLAELRIARDLDLDTFRKYVTNGTITSGSATFAHASDLLFEREVWVLDSSGAKVPLLRKDHSFITEFNTNASQGTPRFYCEYDDTTWEVAPIPSSNTTIGYAYNYRPSSIVDDDTAWINTNIPDLLLFACLIEGAKFLKFSPPEYAHWEQDYARTLAAVTTEETIRERYQEARVGEPRG